MEVVNYFQIKLILKKQMPFIYNILIKEFINNIKKFVKYKNEI